jgi:hypothetical protein
VQCLATDWATWDRFPAGQDFPLCYRSAQTEFRHTGCSGWPPPVCMHNWTRCPSCFEDRVVSKDLWPRRSPDLDLWGLLKVQVYTNRPRIMTSEHWPGDCSHSCGQLMTYIGASYLEWRGAVSQGLGYPPARIHHRRCIIVVLLLKVCGLCNSTCCFVWWWSLVSQPSLRFWPHTFRMFHVVSFLILNFCMSNVCFATDSLKAWMSHFIYQEVIMCVSSHREKCKCLHECCDVAVLMFWWGSLWNKIGKVYSLQHSETPEVFFTPHHWLWRQHGNEGNNKYNSGTRRNSHIRRHCYNNSIWGHCYSNVLQQWPRFMELLDS